MSTWTGYRGDVNKKEGTALHTRWNDFEVVYHLAPESTEEEIRRLIGNDISYILFYVSPVTLGLVVVWCSVRATCLVLVESSYKENL